MNPARKIRIWLTRYGLGAILALAAGFAVLFSTTFGAKIINLSYDLPFINCGLPFLKTEHSKPTELVMVWQDEDAYTQLDQPHNASWDRAVYAHLLDRLTAEGARAVVFDILFTEPNPAKPDGDAEFARAIKANGKVILGAEFTHTADGSPTVKRAIDQFFDAAADWGIVQLDTDEDLTIRRHLHMPREPGTEDFSSMTWQAAHLLGVPEAQKPENRSVKRWMNYYGPPEEIRVLEKDSIKLPGTIPGLSFWQALEVNASCPAGYFSNKVVIVGSKIKTYFAYERKDEYRSPYTGNNFIPGVEVQATEFLNLLRHDWLTRSTFVQEKWMVLLGGLFLGISLARLRPFTATGAALLIAVLVTGLAQYLFWRHQIWFPWLIIVAVQIPVALLWSILYNSFSAYIQNRLLEQSLGLYLSPKQVQRILKEPGLRQPGGSKQVVSILFSDIAGFSRISEQLDPQDLVLLLNSYYETTIRCIHQTDGTIVDIIGDAIFAIWNAPEFQPDHQERMLNAALMFQKNVRQFNGRQGSFALQTRVGLHTGEVVVGNVGSTEHFDYAAIGDNVNLASRLEGLNKQLDTHVLLTRVAIPPGSGDWLLRPVGHFQFKGLDQFVEVVELVVNAGGAEDTRAWREAFAVALAEFGKKNFDVAEAAFQRVLELRPNDGPSIFYLKQVADLRLHPVPENWAGEISLKEK